MTPTELSDLIAHLANNGVNSSSGPGSNPTLVVNLLTQEVRIGYIWYTQENADRSHEIVGITWPVNN